MKNFAFSDLSFDGVVVVLGTLGKDVLRTAGLARVQKPVTMKVVRLKEFDPAKHNQEIVIDLNYHVKKSRKFSSAY
jgi:hypothetical protein